MVNGRTNISMKTFFFDYLHALNIPVLVLHICQGGSITFEMGTQGRIQGFTPPSTIRKKLK